MRALGWSFERELQFYRIAPRAAAYVLILLFEILKANISVIPFIFGKKQPRGITVEFDSPLHGGTANAVLANSITLTPGTITVDARDGHFKVHCLSPEFSQGLDSSVFVGQLLKIEGILYKNKV